jgi:hypothetical protein
MHICLEQTLDSPTGKPQCIFLIAHGVTADDSYAGGQHQGGDATISVRACNECCITFGASVEVRSVGYSPSAAGPRTTQAHLRLKLREQVRRSKPRKRVRQRWA